MGWELRARPDHQELAAGCPRGESLRDGRQRGLDAEFWLGLVQGQGVQEVQVLQGRQWGGLRLGPVRWRWLRLQGVHRVAQAWRRRLPRAPGAACLRRRLVKTSPNAAAPAV